MGGALLSHKTTCPRALIGWPEKRDQLVRREKLVARYPANAAPDPLIIPNPWNRPESPR